MSSPEPHTARTRPAPLSDRPWWRRGALLLAAGAVAALACRPADVTSGLDTDDEEETTVASCDMPVDQIAWGGVGRDGIAALSNPRTVPASHPDADYLEDGDRVIGIALEGQWIAIPHNVLWFHEIVNLDGHAARVAVTYCPLTASGLVFDRSAVEGVDFGVSGLLFNNNLIMFDRSRPESLWPQMSRRARCGPRRPQPLPMLPSAEMTWAAWKGLHPDTRVLARPGGGSDGYTRNPLGSYELDHDLIYFPMTAVDRRLPAKERVLGVPQGGDGGTAYPFSMLARYERRALAQRAAAGELVILWDRTAQGASVFLASAAGEAVTIRVDDGRFVDAETGSEWGFDGVAVSGPSRGRSLEPYAGAYVAFWFAWAAFQPETVIWSDSSR